MTIYPQKLNPGGRVAILSPSGGLPEVFPENFDLGLKRLETIFGLVPVEYPTTRVLNSKLEDRVKDFHNALEDKEIKGIICSIGGDDQIKLLKYLDKGIIKNNSKFFMGYSDATNLCQYITQNAGVVSYYGPAIMAQFGGCGIEMDEYIVDNLKKVFFETGEFEIEPSLKYSETYLDWKNIENLYKSRPMLDSPEWIWRNFSDKQIAGETWGGCLEILDFQLRANVFLPSDDYFENKILYFETSEECPNSDYVYRVLMGMGERKILQKFQAVLVGRARSLESSADEIDLEKIEKYRNSQKEAILKVIAEYCPNTPVLLNLDFGHTDPIFTIPNGGECRIDGLNKKLFFRY